MRSVLRLAAAAALAAMVCAQPGLAQIRGGGGGLGGGGGVGGRMMADPLAQPPRDTTVDTLDVRRPELPVPVIGPGAPLFTPGELEAVARTARRSASDALSERTTIIDCYRRTFNEFPLDARIEGYNQWRDASSRLSGLAEKAMTATQAATKARQDGANGKATPVQVQTAELARQKAVLLMMIAQTEADEGEYMTRDLMQLIRQEVEPSAWRGAVSSMAAAREAGGYQAGFKGYQGLVLSNVAAQPRDSAQGAYLYVTGQIRNERAKAVRVPSLTIRVIDATGYKLKTEIADSRGRIQPGKTLSFAYEVRPAPGRARSVLVVFADPDSEPAQTSAGSDIVCRGAPPEGDEDSYLSRLKPSRTDPTRTGGFMTPIG